MNDVKMGILQRIIKLFVSPIELMHSIKISPVVWQPLLLALALGLSVIPFSDQLMNIASRELTNWSIERHGVDLVGQPIQTDIYGDDADNATDVFAVVTFVVSSFLSPLAGSFFATLLLWLISKIAKGKASFGQLFSMYMHIWIIRLVGTFVVSGLIVATDNFLDLTSLAAVFMPQGNSSMIAFNVLSSISIFSVWFAILAFLGIKVINEFSNIKAGIIAAIVFSLDIALFVGLSIFPYIMLDLYAQTL